MGLSNEFAFSVVPSAFATQAGVAEFRRKEPCGVKRWMVALPAVPGSDVFASEAMTRLVCRVCGKYVVKVLVEGSNEEETS